MKTYTIDELFGEVKQANHRASIAEMRADTAERILEDVRKFVLSDRCQEWGHVFGILGLVICPIDYLKDECKPLLTTLTEQFKDGAP